MVIGELGHAVGALRIAFRSGEDLVALTHVGETIVEEDEDVAEDMEAVRDGSVLALYRLQRNPLVVAFIAEDEVQAMIVGMRPSALAMEIEEYEKAHGSRLAAPEKKEPPVPRERKR